MRRNGVDWGVRKDGVKPQTRCTRSSRLLLRPFRIGAENTQFAWPGLVCAGWEQEVRTHRSSSGFPRLKAVHAVKMGIGGVGLPTDEEHLQGRVQNEDDGACLGDGDASPDQTQAR